MCDFVVVAFFLLFFVVAVCVCAYVRAYWCVCCCLYQKYIYLDKNTSIYCSQTIVVHVHANGFL